MRCIREFAVLLLLLIVSAGIAAAREFSAGDLTIDHPWARATPPGAPSAAVYFTVETTGGGDDLVGASTPVAEHASLHRSVESDGNVTMEPVKSAEVSAETPLRFEPGGYHVMLMGLADPLREGERFPLTLRFADAGDVTVEVAVEAIGSTGAGGGSEDHH